MKIQRIHTKNDTYQLLETLKRNRQKRYKAGCFFVEGVRNINGARRYGWAIESFVYSFASPLSDWATDMLAAFPQADRCELSAELMDELSDREQPSELIAIVRMRADDPSALRFGPSPLIAVFDRPSNKGNLGSVIRSCDALGVDALLLTGHAVDLYDPDVVLSTVGSLFSTPVLRLTEPDALEHFLEGLRKEYPGLRVVGTSAKAAIPVYEQDLTGPIVLMIGNEQTGLSKNYRERVDVMVTIPMAAASYASSFNAACAATVLLYEAGRQRLSAGRATR